MESKWKVIKTKSDAEPWWFFENWERDIVEEWSFDNDVEAIEKYKEQIHHHRSHYPNMKAKHIHSIAFWNPEEIEFCEACDDDLQLFIGLILFKDGKPAEHLPSNELTEDLRDYIMNR
ncbi:DUF1033 family protein [Rossellomorea marisflavi]|uniref:DUF1033 family protein n=1 Tax=Rossellomorea marisflavi TaxID=189381 RepID=UPI0015C431DA|nr:DUF1033 family protein [Rossellomorea marisflavi]